MSCQVRVSHGISPSHLEDGGKAGVCLVANLSIHSFQLTGCRLIV